MTPTDAPLAPSLITGMAAGGKKNRRPCIVMTLTGAPLVMEVQDKTTSTAAQGPSKELDVVLVAHEQPTTSRTWPVFVTLVS